MKVLVNSKVLNNEKFPLGQPILGLILILPLTLILGAVSGSMVKSAALISIPFLIFLLFNFRLSFVFIILLLFINIRLNGIAVAAIFTILLFFSFLVNFNYIRIRDFKSPITSFFLLFLLTCLPSIITTDVLPDVLYEMINLVIFLILLLLCVAVIKNQSDIKKFFTVFITLSLLNSFYLIYDAVITKSRSFGFAGVMFVDYVGVAIIVIFIWFLLSNGSKKLFYLPVLAILMLASILTQTRNAWISIFLLILLLVSFFYFNSRKYKLSRRILLTFLVLTFVSAGAIYSSLKIINPSVSERAEQFTESKGEILTEKGEVTSSLVSRLFIWDTALNAFRDKPVTGVGIYAFPYVSQKYYTIPKILYDNYVYGRTPHITYLAIATEAGIIGLFGFLIFILSTLKFSYESINLSETNEENLVSISLFFSLFYIVISMLMTDAWLWDQGIVLWGIILGLSMANRKILLEKITNKNKIHL